MYTGRIMPRIRVHWAIPGNIARNARKRLAGNGGEQFFSDRTKPALWMFLIDQVEYPVSLVSALGLKAGAGAWQCAT